MALTMGVAVLGVRRMDADDAGRSRSTARSPRDRAHGRDDHAWYVFRIYLVVLFVAFRFFHFKAFIVSSGISTL